MARAHALGDEELRSGAFRWPATAKMYRLEPPYEDHGVLVSHVVVMQEPASYEWMLLSVDGEDGRPDGLMTVVSPGAFDPADLLDMIGYTTGDEFEDYEEEGYRW